MENNQVITVEVEDRNLNNRFSVRSTVSAIHRKDLEKAVDLLMYQNAKGAEQLQREIAAKYGEVADAAAHVLVQLLGDPKYQPYTKLYAEQYSPAVRRLHEALYKMGVPEARKYAFSMTGLTNP